MIQTEKKEFILSMKAMMLMITMPTSSFKKTSRNIPIMMKKLILNSPRQKMKSILKMCQQLRVISRKIMNSESIVEGIIKSALPRLVI